MNLLLVCFLFFAQAQANQPEAPVKATVCELKSQPAAYEHKLVEVTGFVMTGGREDFDLFDPACPEWPDVDLEEGGGTIESIQTVFRFALSPGESSGPCNHHRSFLCRKRTAVPEWS
jgi:hypothetical protein